jgi:hypothetical protein
MNVALDPELYALVNAADLVERLPPLFQSAVSQETLAKTWIVPLMSQSGPDFIKISTGVLFDEPLALSIPGLDAVQLVVGGVQDATIFEVDIDILPEPKLSVKDVTFALRLDKRYFKPARLNPQTNAYEVDPDRTFVDIQLGTVTLSIDPDAGVVFTGNTGPIDLPPTMIGESGVVIQASDLQAFLNDQATPPGKPAGTRGVAIASAQVFLPGTMGRSVNLAMTNAFIGNGGFSGAVSATINPPIEEDLGGFAVALSSVGVTFVQNALTESALTGTMKIPYFDKRVTVSLAVGLDGLMLAVTGVAPGQGTFDPAKGILTLSAGPLTFALNRFAIEVTGGDAILRASGRVTPQVTDLTFPAFDIQELSIDRHGKLTVAGGWINLPNQVSLDLFGFILEITKLGFGTLDDGRRWIGFSGGLKLIDGIKAGASVDGLRVMWDSNGAVSLSLDGVGVELEVPKTLILKGSVSLTDREFRGAVQISLPSLNLSFDGQFVAGTLPAPSTEKFFAVFVRAELPAGLPLGATGLAIYGAAGLYANNMEPDKRTTEGWYDNPDHSDGWYLRDGAGVANLAKWRGKSSAMAFGAGVTLGTFSDNGYTFNGRLLLVVAFPGPVIFIEGKANLFRKRSDLFGDDPMFRALAVIDAGKSFLIAVDAQFKYKDGGELVDMTGSAEAFFDFQSAENWHIFLGLKDNPKRRIRARLFKLFTVESYLQLNARQVDYGAAWSFDKSYGFKHLNVHVGASLEVNASLSWHPAHFAGSASLRGRAELRAFGIGAGLSVGATISGEVFEPMHLEGAFSVGIDLPWPLPDVGATITLKWEEALNAPPPLPLPLQEAAAEIPSRALRWPFRRGTNLLPSYDQGALESSDGAASGDTGGGLTGALLIPSDAQLGLTFSRPIDDPANVGNNPTRVKAEVVGDPVSSDASKGYTVAYKLSSVVLEKLAPIAPGETPGTPLPPGQSGVGWVPVAQTGGSAPAGRPKLFGAWTQAGPPQLPASQQSSSGTTQAQTKLMVNAKSPLEYTALASEKWDEWFSEANPAYPCTDGNPNEDLVAFFDQEIGSEIGPDFGTFRFESPPFEVSWMYGGDILANEEVVQGVLGPLDRGLRLQEDPSNDDSEGDGGASVTVKPPPGNDEVRIRVGAPAEFEPFGQFGEFLEFDNPSVPHFLEHVIEISAFLTDGEGRQPLPPPRGGRIGAHVGMLFQFGVELRPIVPALEVELVLFGELFGSEDNVGGALVQFFDPQGSPLLAEPRVVDVGASRVRFRAAEIASIEITCDTARFVLERIFIRSPLEATAISNSDPTALYGPFEEEDGLLTVKGTDLGTISLSSRLGGVFLLLELSLPSRQDEVIRHIVESLEQFKQAGPVFEPETNYRLTINSNRDARNRSQDAKNAAAKFDFKELTFFRTAALPGVGVPAAPEGTQTSNNSTPVTGFEDLGFYVRGTVPEIPPPAGGHQSPARAVYRAYDADVTFRPETVYVELMYRLGRRDLTLRFFDADSQPLRNEVGRLLVAQSHWGQSTDPTISSSTKRWIATVNAAACIADPDFDEAQVLRSEVFSAPTEEMLLAPQTLHQVRLVPMLLHETFVGARLPLVANGQGSRLDRWHAEAATSTAVKWTVKSETTSAGGQTVTIWWATEETNGDSALVYEGALASIAETSGHDHPSQWTDVRASVQVRWTAQEVGLDVRRGAGGLLRAKMSRSPNGQAVTVQLLSIVGGTTTVLGESSLDSLPGSDRTLTIECVGSHAEVFEHGVGEPPLFPLIITDAAPVVSGTVALFAKGAQGLRFSDIQVHDLRKEPSTAHRFDFITSKYANFFHHLHGFDDQLFEVAAGAGVTAANLAAQASAAVALPATAGPGPGVTPVSEAEGAAFNALESAALGLGAVRAPESLEILAASHDASVNLFLVRSPEPVRWERTQLVVGVAGAQPTLGIPDGFKLAAVRFASAPIDEGVTVLVRDHASLADHRIDWRPLPDTADPDPSWTAYFLFSNEEETLGDGTQVRLFSGDASAAPPRPPGTTQRFVAIDPPSAEVHFPASGVELRLLAPDGTVIHQRQFLPDGDFTPTAMRAIRKVDGTAFFLFPAAGVTLPSAFALRLSFAFARNAGTQLPTLRQAGDETAETANLDVVP